MFLVRLILCILLIAWSTPAMAATLTVGSGQTYSTITAAEAAAQNGDTIRIYSGTYNEAVTFDVPNLTIEVPTGQIVSIPSRGGGFNASWTIQAANITIQAHSSENEVFTGVARPYGRLLFTDPTLSGYSILTGTHTRAIQVSYLGDNAKIFGVTITGRSDYDDYDLCRAHIRNGITTAGDATEIAYCYTYQLTRHPVGHQDGVPLLWVHHNKFEKYGYGNGVMLSGKSGQEDVYYVRAIIEDNYIEGSYSSDGVQSNSTSLTVGVEDVTAIVIRRNVIFNMGENCIDPKGARFVLVENNYLGGAIGDSNGPWDGTQLNSSFSIGSGSGQTSSHYISRYNVVIDGAGGMWPRDYFYGYHNTTVNLARDYRGPNQTTALDTVSYSSGFSTRWDYSAYINNISVNSVGGLAAVDFGNGSTANHAIIDYNMYHNPNYNGGVVRFGSKGTPQQFHTWAMWQSYGYDTHGVLADPRLNLTDYLPTGDPSQFDFRLLPGSPAIDTGTWLCTVASVDGNVITISEAYRARMFYDGFGIPGETGDTIYDDDGNSAVVVSIDRSANSITVDDATGFTAGDGLTTVDYIGTKPDIGAFEYVSGMPTVTISGLVPI